MDKNIEVLKNDLEKIIRETHSLTDGKVVMLSQELDKLIVKQQLCKLLNLNY